MVIDRHTENRIRAIISNRLDSMVTITEVTNWLSNFEEKDWYSAIEVLEKFEFISVHRTVKIYNDGLKAILNSNQQKNVVFIPIGQVAKSGSAMSYFIKQTPILKDKRYKRKFNFLSSIGHLEKEVTDGNLPKSDLILILVDDFLGSGNSAIDYYNGVKGKKGLKQSLNELDIKPTLNVLSLIILSDANKNINKSIEEITLYGEHRNKVFTSNGSVFGYRPKMVPVREFCYEYGKQFESKNCKPLGFDNSQGLVAFAHTTPNNTLPIFWSSKNDWYPLFPRFGDDKIEKAESFRKDIRYWLSIAASLGLEGFEKDDLNLYKKLNFRLIAIIRLKKMNRSVPVICQYIGITLNDYELSIKNGVDKGIFSKDGELTKKGERLYSEILKKIAIIRTREKNIMNLDNDILYVPKTFRGKT